MRLDPATVLALAASCASQVAPDTMLAVARVESGLDPLAISVNGIAAQRLTAPTPAAAAALANKLIASGRNVDLGLAQINVRNLVPLGLSITGAFDPCRNLAASATLLRSGWARATAARQTPIAAISATLSLYNTGTPTAGVRNGYVGKVLAAAGSPALASTPPPSEPPAPTPSWRVFPAGPRPNRFVLTPISGASE